MRNKIFPFIIIGVMAALFNIMQIDSDWPAWSIIVANILFALCNIFAAVMSFRKKDNEQNPTQ